MTRLVEDGVVSVPLALLWTVLSRGTSKRRGGEASQSASTSHGVAFSKPALSFAPNFVRIQST